MKLSSAVGLDIGTTSVKVIQISQKNSRLKLDSIGVIPTPSRGILSESLVDQQVIGDAIKKMLREADISESSLSIAIPQSQVFAKIIELPKLSSKELAAALAYEMDQYVPLPLDQVRTDWEILSERDNGTMDVLIIAAPLSIIEKYEKILSVADLVPRVVETELVAVMRALAPSLSSVSPKLVVHLGASTTDLMIVKENILQVIFSVGLGGVAITRAISVDHGIDIKQAENYKRSYGITENVFKGEIGSSLAPVLESILGDIRKTILAYKNKHGNEDISEIILSGGNAYLPGIDSYFSDQFKKKVSVVNCWEIHGIEEVPDQIFSDSASFNVVTGLALRDVL